MAQRRGAGNRLAVPAALNDARHFFYRTQPPALSEEDRTLICEAVLAHYRTIPCMGSEVDVLSRGVILGWGAAVRDAVERLDSAMLSLGPKSMGALVDLLACRWAGPHSDEPFAGEAFYSFVLHTGPSPYTMNLFYTDRERHGERLPTVTCSSHRLKVGDAFVFDPTTPHLAAPEEPRDGQLLLLAQCTLKDKNARERAELVEVMPPRKTPGDMDCWYV